LQAALAIAAVSAEAEADAYTIGQVAAGLPLANAIASGRAHNPGYISSVSYPASSVYSGYAAGYGAGLVRPVAAYSAFPSVYGAHYIGKRSADSEAEADAYTLGQVAAGLPVANAYATGHAHNPGYISHVEYPSSNVYSGYAAAPAVAAYSGYSGYAAAPALSSYSAYPSVYGAHYIGKRSADAEADAYTIGQVAAGLPVANAYATGHAHNVGYINHVSHPASNVYSGYAAVPAVAAYTGYSGLAHAGYGYNTIGYTGAYLG